ncbi:hypothetical protein, partial [Novacetimonas maltaceti]
KTRLLHIAIPSINAEEIESYRRPQNQGVFRTLHLMLLQDPDDPLLCETCFLHRLSLMDRPYFKSRAFQGAGSIFPNWEHWEMDRLLGSQTRQ